MSNPAFRYCQDYPLGKLAAARGFSFIELCFVSEIDRWTLSRYLNNRCPIADEHLECLADALDVLPEQILGIAPLTLDAPLTHGH